MKPIAYSYVRFSTPEQQDGDSLRRQLADTVKWCEVNGVELDTKLTFRDLGKSGFTGANFDEGALGRFIALVKNGTIRAGSFLVLEALDRFSRENAYIAAGRLFELVNAGISIVAVQDNVIYSTEKLSGDDPTPLMVLVLKLSQGHSESVKKAYRVGKAWKQKKLLARTEKRPLTKRCPEWLYVDSGQFHIHEDRANTVRRLFAETIAGYGRRAIVERLNAEAIPAFRGKNGWQSSTVQKIIAGKAVLGEYQPHSGRHIARNRKPDGEPIQDFYPAIVDEATYWQAQAAVNGRRHAGGGRTGKKNSHILKGVAKCAACASSMHVVDKGKPPKGAVYLVCDAAKRGLGCDNRKLYRLDNAEEQLLNALTIMMAPDLHAEDDAAAQELAISGLRAKLAEKQKARSRLLDLLETVDFDDETRNRFQTVAADIKKMQAELEEAERALKEAAAEPSLGDRLDLLRELKEKLNNADLNMRLDFKVQMNALVRNVVDSVTFSELPGLVMTITKRSAFYQNGRILSMGGQGVGLRFLLEDADVVSDEVYEAFFGHPRSNFDWG